MDPGKKFLNYYWTEEPLPGDQGCRITVLHSGQEKQSKHCLKTGAKVAQDKDKEKCVKYLEQKWTERLITQKTGYESLKAKHLRQYPSLGKDISPGLKMTEIEAKVTDDVETVTTDSNTAKIATVKEQIKTKEKENEGIQLKSEAAKQKHFQK